MKQGYNNRAWNTCSNECMLLYLLFIPNKEDSVIFNHLITSIMEIGELYTRNVES